MWKCRNNSGSKEKKTSNCFWFGYETKQKPYSITKNRQNKKNTIKLSKTKFKWYGKKITFVSRVVRYNSIWLSNLGEN